MEVTNGLLSNLVETKSMEAVLAPISSQVSQLIMVCESNSGWRSSESATKSAETVKQIILDLINVAKMKAAESKHQTYKADMLNASEMLSLAADNFYTSALSLQQNPQSKNARRAVVQAAKDALQGTMRVLLIRDEAEVKAIVEAACKVNAVLSTLTTASNMNELVSMFRMFMEAMVHLTRLASRRQLELIRTRQREKVIMGLGVLKKAVPLLNTALKSYVKHPDSSQAKVSRDYAVKQIETGLTDITDAVSNRFTEEDYLGLEEAGFFVSKLDQLLEALTEVGRKDIPGNFEMWAQDIIAHSMAVAHQCTDAHRELIISNCQRILLQKGRLLELFVTFRVGHSPVSAEVREDYDEVCEGLIDEFCDLERHVNMAVLHLIVLTFCQTTETLDKLVQTAMQQAVTGGEWFSVLNHHIVIFGEHADKVCQVASLAAASSTDAKRVRRIRLCIHRLEQLDPEVVPAAVACLKSGGDRQAIQHMRLLKEEWRHEFEELLQVLDDMTDPRIFMDVSEEQLVQDLNTCNGLLMVHDLEEIADVFHAMAGKARRVVQVAKQIADAMRTRCTGTG
ncbi:catenin alpha-2-like [Liolophura sinensis]|uniref:catenin alpha-2-like n=1 Tax=Liolophura sinensis TaxID=3198878 RepID=UPI0031592C3F